TEADTLIALYHGLQSPLNNYLANYSSFNKELKEAQTQVKDLGNDLKKGFINEKSSEFYELELNLANDIISKSNSLALDFENVLIKFNALQPKILSLVEERANMEATKTE
ncbi:MAG: hypothetical protein H0X62_08830, partial [Bacteroidetes bacterium]|nr:hypothetical protein [Bacteroidota bacterium]